MEPKHPGGKDEMAKQLDELTRTLAKASGVKEEDVKKVIEQLGLARVHPARTVVVQQISLNALQSAVRKALTVVIA
jgi:hypothetical protein